MLSSNLLVCCHQQLSQCHCVEQVCHLGSRNMARSSLFSSKAMKFFYDWESGRSSLSITFCVGLAICPTLLILVSTLIDKGLYWSNTSILETIALNCFTSLHKDFGIVTKAVALRWILYKLNPHQYPTRCRREGLKRQPVAALTNFVGCFFSLFLFFSS